MNDDLTDELAAVHAIYDCPTLIVPSASGDHTFILQPTLDIITPQLYLRLHIPPSYPTSKPVLLDDASSSRRVALAHDALDGLWRPGEVCLYDLIEALREKLAVPVEDAGAEEEAVAAPRTPTPPPTSPDPWFVAEAIAEKKSVFVGRAVAVCDAAAANELLARLLADRKLAKATHNISAYRIVRENGTVVQDNDDDGETAAGGRLAHLLQLMDVKGALVVVSRWYGGVKLGPDRFRLINMAAREALVGGGLVVEESGGKGKGKKKGR